MWQGSPGSDAAEAHRRYLRPHHSVDRDRSDVLALASGVAASPALGSARIVTSDARPRRDPTGVPSAPLGPLEVGGAVPVGDRRMASSRICQDALANGKISSYSPCMPRRKPGTLLPLEMEILEVALSLLGTSKESTFHGFGLAHRMRERSGSRSLTGHGTLYKALGRLEERGLLSSRWEDAAAAEGRPRRRLYELTPQGVQVAEQALAGRTERPIRHSPRISPEPA